MHVYSSTHPEHNRNIQWGPEVHFITEITVTCITKISFTLDTEDSESEANNNKQETNEKRHEKKTRSKMSVKR